MAVQNQPPKEIDTLRETLARMERDSTTGINQLLSATSAVSDVSSRVATRATLTSKLRVISDEEAETAVGTKR